MSSVVTNPAPEPQPLAFPLDVFYRHGGISLPPLESVDPQQIPEPYRGLLAQPNDLTGTLETFHAGQIRLRILGRELHGNSCYWELILKLEADDRPVAYGAARIHLNRLPVAARELILQGRRSLGRILKELDIPFVCQPAAFLRVASDRIINSALNLSGAQVLYGRSNVLFSPARLPLAEGLEILPPETVRRPVSS